MTDELDVTNYDPAAERAARGGELSTEAIRQIIQRWREKPDSEPGWRDWLADEAEATLAALLKRNEELETENARKDQALRYFLTYHLEGIGQLTHAIGGAEAALTRPTRTLRDRGVLGRGT